MSTISLATLLELIVNLLERCGTPLLSQDEDMISFYLWEEFWPDAYSFLHDGNLASLREAGYVDDQCRICLRGIRQQWLSLTDREWPEGTLKTSVELHRLCEMCDTAIQKIKSI